MTLSVYSIGANTLFHESGQALEAGLYAIDTEMGEAIAVVQEGDGYAIDHSYIFIEETRDIRFSKYVYAEDPDGNPNDDFEAVQEQYDIMDNVEGFDWGDVGKVRIQTVVRDHNDPDNINVEERVQFVEITDNYHNWDYFRYENDGGYVTVEMGADEEVVYTAFQASEDTFTLQELATSNSEYFNIRDQIIENHRLIESEAPDLAGLEINVLPGDDIVATNAAGDIMYSGWFHSDDEPHSDGRMY